MSGWSTIPSARSTKALASSMISYVAHGDGCEVGNDKYQSLGVEQVSVVDKPADAADKVGRKPSVAIFPKNCSKSDAVISQAMMDDLVKAVLNNTELNENDKAEVLEDLALVLSMLRCSVAAFGFYSSKLQGLLQSQKKLDKMILKSIIDVSRTAVPDEHLNLAWSLLKQVFGVFKIARGADGLCHCIYRQLLSVLTTNGWSALFREYKAENNSFRLDMSLMSVAALGSAGMFTLSGCTQSCLEGAGSAVAWLLAEGVLTDLLPWAMSRIVSIDSLNLLLWCADRPLDTCHEILLSCYLIRAWILNFPVLILHTPDGLPCVLDSKVTTAVKVFALIARYVIQNIKTNHGSVSARELSLDHLRLCSDELLRLSPPMRAEQLTLLYKDLFIPDLRSREWTLQDMPEEYISDIAWYIRDTISMVTNFLTSRQIDGDSRVPRCDMKQIKAGHDFQVVFGGVKTSAVPISGPSLRSVSIRSSESMSLRSFRSTSKRARKLLERFSTNHFLLTLTPRSSMLRESWRFSSLIAFINALQVSVRKEAEGTSID